MARLRGDEEEARGLLMRSIELMSDADAPILAWAYRELGRVSSGNRNEAEKALRRSIELYESTEQVVETAVTYGALGDLLRENGEETGGCEAYRMGITLLEQST